MEHLFFNPEKSQLNHFADKLSTTETWDCDWELVPPIEQETTWRVFDWLSFPHDANQVVPTETSFLDYPKVRGWNVAELAVSNLRSMHGSVTGSDFTDTQIRGLLASMLQSWVFFGFLEATFEKPISTTFLVRKDGTRWIIDTRNLTFALYAKVAGANRKYPMDHERGLVKHARKVQKALNSVCGRIEVFVQQLSDGDVFEIEGQEIPAKSILETVLAPGLLASGIVSHTYNFICERIVNTRTYKAVPYQCPVESLLTQTHQELARAGVCRYLTTRMRFPSLSTLKWLSWWASSARIATVEDHSKCTSEMCKLDEVDLGEPLHAPGCSESDCRMVRPSEKEIYSCLEHGKVPLIELERDTGGHEIKIRIQQRPLDKLSSNVYTAFSHVWRHGLGSTTEQGLPACRLSQFWEIQLMTYGSNRPTKTGEMAAPFWLDSLCIPSSRRHRTLAIQSMNKIYENATVVTVIDAALAKLRKGDSAESKLAAIQTSGWRTRLWTFLEGYLAPFLAFALHDEVFVVRGEGDIDPALLRDRSVPEHTAIIKHRLLTVLDFRVCDASFKDYESNKLGGPDPSTGFMGRLVSVRLISDFMLAMRNRSTTKPDDEAIVLAVAFSLNTRGVLEANGDRRMCAFYDAMVQIPVYWLFLGLPPLTTTSYSSLPRTLLMKNAPVQFPRLTDSEKRLDITPRGTEMPGPCILLNFAHATMTGTSSRVLEFESVASGQTWYCVISPCGDSGTRFEPLTWKNSTFDMVILQPRSLYMQFETDIFGDGQRGVALLAKWLDTDRKAEVDVKTRFTCTVVATVAVEFPKRETFAGQEPDYVDFRGFYRAGRDMVLI